MQRKTAESASVPAREVSVDERDLSGSLVARTAQQLGALSLERAEGEYLGSEDELRLRLGVSRPTLRQAAKVAESERMIKVRRGSFGGFYAARPGVQDAIRALTSYLRLRGATLKHMSITNSVGEAAVALAALCEDEGRRGELRELLAELDGLCGVRPIVSFDTRFFRLIGEMSGNPVAELLIMLFYSFGREEQNVRIYAQPWQQATAKAHLKAIAEAVLARDAELARFMMRRRLTAIRSWIDDEESERRMDDNGGDSNVLGE